MRRIVKSVILIVFPIVLNSLSLPSARIEGENIVPLDTIKLIAYQNAKALWGAVAMSPPIPYCDMDGNIRAYGFTFAIEKGSFPTYDQILDEIEESKDKWMVENYASMLISARYDKPPIIRYGRGLGVYYARGEKAKNKAIKVLNTTEVKLTRIYYAAPYIVWFEFVSPQGKLMVNPYNLTIKTPEEFEKIRYKVKEKERKKINESTYKEWLEHIKEQWKKFQRGETLSKSDHCMPDYEMVPYYDWHYGCAPTAAAMVLGFYDNNYTVYGNLIWHFFEEWDDIEWETDYHVADAQKWLADLMGTDETGGTYPDSIEPGIEEYTNEWCGYSFDVIYNYYWYPPWAWDEIVNEINNNRPVLWGYGISGWGAHAVTIVGYTDDDYLIIHNTWWMGLDYLDIYELDEAWLYRVYPGGGYGFDVKLEEPCGGMGLEGDPYDENGCYVVWRAGGCYVIVWDNHGYTGGYVDIYFSDEGGCPGTWYYLGTTENDGVTWICISSDATPTTSARIMILGTTSTKEVTEDTTFVIGVKGGSQHLNIRTPMLKNEKSIISGDGSYGSFQIVGNTDPELTFPDVDPDEGTPDTDFYYYVHYYDADGDAPSVIKVYIDGEGHNMILDSGSVANGRYKYGPHHFEPGSHSHSYYFYCEDDYGGTDRLPETGSYSGPITNTCPELANPAVTPDEGTPDTDFYYSVHYYDADGDAPSVIKVYIDGEGHDMELVSGSPSNGTYRYGPHNFESGSHSHSFYFYVSDGYCEIRLPDVGSYSGPFINTPPELSDGDVTPDEGTTEDTFRYTVYYYDADGDAPDTKWVYIDGSPHTMSLYSGSASNGWYEYKTMLGVGSHNYYFYFTDGYGGSDTLPSTGTYSGPNVEQPAGYKIEGDLCYYSNDATIYPAIVYLMGDVSDSIWVDENGHYMFDDLAGGLDYCVKPYKEDDDRGAISPFDASYVLRFYVNALTLDPYQRIAADVTGNGDITPFDASYILRYYVGIIDTFPVGSWKFVPEAFSIDTTNWTYAPDSICYPDLNTDYTNENYRGILYGDVTGNWAAGQIASLHKGSKNNEIISIPDKLFAVPGDTIEVPFTLSEGEANAFSLGLVIEYDPQIIEVISVDKTSLTEDWLMSHCAKNGILRIGLAGARSIKKGIPLKIKFHVKKSQTSPIETKIKLVEVQVNENCINDLVSTQLTISEELARFYKLSESYPNPFSTYTTIEYFLPTKSRVTLTIYNLCGEVVKVLVNKVQESGTHKVCWDGKDDKGELLPNGIYFYELRTPEFRMCKKCIVVR